MGFLVGRQFRGGWQPNLDPLARTDALLRADNLVLDQEGTIALRAGSAKINSTPFADTDIHSLFTGVLGGTRYRMAGAGAQIYANGTSLGLSMAGSGDVAFGSYLGQLLFARATSKYKYDGTTVRNWGLSMTGGAPTVAAVASATATFISGASTESPAVVIEEDDGTGIAYATGADGVANGAAVVNPSDTTNRATFTKTFAADTDFTALSGGVTATDDSLLSFSLYLTEPLALVRVFVAIAVNSALTEDFWQNDYYYIDLFAQDVSGEGTTRINFTPTAGWNTVTVPRKIILPDLEHPNGSLLQRQGSTAGKNWTTVKAVKVSVQLTGGGSANQIRFDQLQIAGGPVTAERVQYKYVYVRNDGTSLGLSAPSAASAETPLRSQGTTVTAPADGSRDSQINEIWVYRIDDHLDQYYRVKVETGVSGTGTVAISDTLSSADALTANLPLETTNTTPPDTILDIEGPYYDRVFALTATHLYPSRRLSLDAFSSAQAVRVSGADETAYWVKKALGGLYVGTSKDIYRLDGTGAELPDGSVDFTVRPINIDHPPIGGAIAQDGNVLIYLGDDGWRVMAGAGSEALAGATSLLYRGQARHGVSAVNLTTGRFKAAIAKGELVAITPEGASTTSSAVLYRRRMPTGDWYRHPYGSQAWRSIITEPDGTLIASDSAGFVWALDTGTQDAGTDLAVVLWTPIDDTGNPFQRKRPFDLRVHADTGGATATASVHLDGSASAATAVSVATSGYAIGSFDLVGIAACRLAQLRLTGSFSTCRIGALSLGALDLPMPIRGRVAETDAGYPGVKTLSGLQLRVCTRGAAVTFTPVLDGDSQTTFTVTSGTDDPDDVTHAFLAATDAINLGLLISDDVELYSWEPIITTQRPLGIRFWDSGPMDLGSHDLVWVREIRVKVRAAEALTITPYFDGVAFAAVTTTPSAAGETVLHVPVGRAYKGITPRVTLASDAVFYPYWIEFVRRSSRAFTEKPTIRVPIRLGGQVAA